ncbi:MAG: hypothetical protein WCR19_02450 [Acholeplasmataceae bacterium]
MVKQEHQIIARNYELAGRASSKLKRYLKELNIDKHLMKRICSASYEAEINVVIHSVGGYVIFEFHDTYIELNFYDDGPGILDINLAMTEGYSTASENAQHNGFGAGMGLSNIKNCSDEMILTSSIDGTHLKIIFFLGENHA